MHKMLKYIVISRSFSNENTDIMMDVHLRNKDFRGREKWNVILV